MDLAAELARMNAAGDAIFALPALFKPAAGGEHPCRAEKFLPEAEFGFADAKAVASDARLVVTKSLLPGPPIVGDMFAFETGDVWRVIASPVTADDDGLRWTIKVEAVET